MCKKMWNFHNRDKTAQWNEYFITTVYVDVVNN